MEKRKYWSYQVALNQALWRTRNFPLRKLVFCRVCEGCRSYTEIKFFVKAISPQTTIRTYEIYTSHGHLVLIPGIEAPLKPDFHKLKTIRTIWLPRLNIFNKMVVLFAVIPWRLLVSLAQIIRYEFVHDKLAQILASVLRLKIPCKTSSFFFRELVLPLPPHCFPTTVLVNRFSLLSSKEM